MPAAVETMAYVGDTPWHGLGVELPKNPTVDAIRAAAGLTWEPAVVPLTYVVGETVHTSKRAALVRDDTGAELDVVGPSYVPIKNDEVVEFFRAYAETGRLTLETAGVLDNGRYVWCLARMSDEIVAGDTNDRVRAFVLLANPHVYGRGAVTKYTAVRVVCSNTLQMALSGSAGVRIWHTSEFDAERRAQVAEQLGLAQQHHEALARDVEILVNTKLHDQTVRRVIARAFKREPTAARKADAASRVEARVFALYKGEGKGATLPSADGTAWGVLNAVTQYVDWERGKTANNRIRSSWFGDGVGIKARARRELLTVKTKKGGQR